MKRTTSPILAAPLLALFLAAGDARADVSDADRATARTLATEGQTALVEGDYATAADRYARADQLFHAPTLLLGLARAQVGLGKLVSAEETYRRILREGLPPKPPAAFVKALQDAEKELQALGPRIAHVTIHVAGAAESAVTIDGEPVPGAAVGVRRPIDPGRHVIRAVAGSAVSEAVVDLGEGKAEVVTLSPKEPVGAPREHAAPQPAKSAGWPPVKTAGVVALGVGGTVIALGAAAGIVAVVQHGKLSNKCNNGVCSPTEQGAIDAYHLSGTLSTAGFVVGGAVAATGVVLMLVAPKAIPSRDAALRPIFGPGFVGLGGRFR